jgi:hypothetical protein
MAGKAALLHRRGDVDIIMVDRHIGAFRKDYDVLAARMKRLPPLEG